MTDQAPTTPDSVVVPVEPTREMIDAAFDAFEIDDPKQYETGTDARNAIYRAMLAARPAATPGGEREAIARIIDPDAWIMTDHWRSLVNRPDLDQRIHERQQPSLVKAAAILAALSHHAPVAGGAVAREAIASAYEAGAMSVHEYWTENPGEAPRGDPEFSEAAYDYAASVLATPTPQPAAARGGEVHNAVVTLQAYLDDFDRENADAIDADDFNVGQDEHIEVPTATLRRVLAALALSAKGGS